MNVLSGMSTGTRIVLGVMVALLLGGIALAIAAVMMYVSANNYGATTEASIKARWQDNQNVFSNYGQKVAEAAQVPAMYRDDLVKVMTSAISSRYGEEGSKAVFQWLTEAKIDFDSALYVKIQQIIESGRNDFQNAQTQRLDVCRQWDAELNKIPRGWFLRLAGYPKIFMETPNICKAISDDRTEKAFSTGKQETIKLR